MEADPPVRDGPFLAQIATQNADHCHDDRPRNWNPSDARQYHRKQELWSVRTSVNMTASECMLARTSVHNAKRPAAALDYLCKEEEEEHCEALPFESVNVLDLFRNIVDKALVPRQPDVTVDTIPQKISS
jgi:hypothetical protein